jgi:2'-5' RNA ligase superfamily
MATPASVLATHRYDCRVADATIKSALLVPLPEVEPFVATWREELDPASRRGIPAHVTALFPFVLPGLLNSHTITTLATLVSNIEQFDVTFFSSWFDDRVFYLAPTPDDGFRDITEQLVSAFPQCRPYEGKYDDPTPHLTVGDGAPKSDLRRAEDALRPSLPLLATAKELWLMAGGMEPQSWTVLERFPFKSR